MNEFTNILLSKGFSRGASGRFFDPDAARYDSGITVELRDEGAVLFSGKLTKTFPDTPDGVQEFRAVLPA
jgi:hypothetical protein